MDFAGSRVGTGATVALQTRLRPTDHLELAFNDERRWLNVPVTGGEKSRLFTAAIDRLRATYNFTSRVFPRAIIQWVETVRDPTLYSTPVARRTGDLTGSGLFAYKLNWQTVLFLGFADNRTLLAETDQLEPTDRSLFLKVSYAFQG